jgi:hypothetical protein
MMAPVAAAEVHVNAPPGHYKPVAVTKELQELFAELDMDSSGSLSRSEVRSMACRLGFDCSEDDVDEAMAEMDTDGSGLVGGFACRAPSPVSSCASRPEVSLGAGPVAQTLASSLAGGRTKETLTARGSTRSGGCGSAPRRRGVGTTPRWRPTSSTPSS